MIDKQDSSFRELAQAIIDMDETAAQNVARCIVENGFDCAVAIEIGLSAGMAKVSELFENGEYFIPDLLVCAETAESASVILRKGLKREPTYKGRVVIGTIFGDTHDIGKNIVALFMESAGYEVFDLGKNVSARTFVNEAERHKADVIAISTLMTTTMRNMESVIDLLTKEHIRDKYKVIIGGKPVSENFANKIGADGYAETAAAAVRLLQHIISNKEEKSYGQEN